MNEKSYLRVVKGFAIYDLVALGPFALPFLAAIQLSTFSSIHTSLNLPGSDFPIFEPSHMLFLNLLGLLGIFWSLWRLRHASIEIGIFEGWARVGFAGLMLYHILVGNISSIALAFIAVDVVGAALHLYGYSLRAK